MKTEPIHRRPARVATVTLNPAIDHSVGIPGFSPGNVNRVDWEQADAGGKGVNVASFLSDLGASVSATGFLGRDNASAFEQLFASKGVADHFVRLPGKTRVNVKILDEAQHRVTDINFPGLQPQPADLAQLMRVVAELAVDHDWFVLSGSVPAGLPDAVYAELVSALKSAGKQVLLDTSGEPLRLALRSTPYAIKPNVAELEQMLGHRLPDQAAVAAAAHDLLGHGIGCVVVSMGREGALFVDATQSLLAVPPAVQVRSTVGAGDAMVAGLVAARLRGMSLADSARLATATAMGALAELGPRLPPLARIEASMSRVDVRSIER